MASSSDSSQKMRDAVMEKRNRGPPFKFLIPLLYAPVLSLIRLSSLRHKPVLRDRLFTFVLAGGFAHGLYLVQGIGLVYVFVFVALVFGKVDMFGWTDVFNIELKLTPKLLSTQGIVWASLFMILGLET